MALIDLPADDLVSYRFSLYPPPQESESALKTNFQLFHAAGARWQVELSLRNLPDHRFASWSDLYIQGTSFLWPIPQPGFTPDNAGAPVVDGDNQLGTSLTLRGVTPGYTVSKDRWITVTTDGVARTYQMTQDAVASGTGALVLSLNPMLIRAPSDGDAVELVTPSLTGLIVFSSFERTAGFSRTAPFLLRQR